MSDRAVFDCMVYLQAASRPQRVHGLFEAVIQGELTLFVSPEILAEIRDVLLRPSIVRKFPALTPETINAFLTAVLSHATLIPDPPSAFPLPRDPKDEKYINLAVAVQAVYLASADNDLLDLMDPSSTTGQIFVKQFPHLCIRKPGTLLRELQDRRNEQRDPASNS